MGGSSRLVIVGLRDHLPAEKLRRHLFRGDAQLLLNCSLALSRRLSHNGKQ
jgi:hypothetical protein